MWQRLFKIFCSHISQAPWTSLAQDEMIDVMSVGRLLCLLVSCYWSVVHDARATNPGLKIRLSQSGLNYAATVAVQQMFANVRGASLPDQSGQTHTVVGTVRHEVKNWRVGI